MTGLRKPCEHGRYEVHSFVETTKNSLDLFLTQNLSCPGGEFLTDDALVIECLIDAKDKAARVLAERWGWTHPDDLEIARSNIDETIDALTALSIREGAE